MKKNTLVISVLIGLGSLAAFFAMVSTTQESQYVSRESASEQNVTAFNSDFFEQMRKNVNTGKVEASDFINASNQIRQRSSRAALGVNWSYAGPDNIGGLTRSIVIDNVDNNKLYAAADGGGVLVSTNAGGSWEYKSDNWVNINVGGLAQDPDGRLYAGTGVDYNQGSKTVGGGMYVSDDRGETWSLLASTIPSISNKAWEYVNRIVISTTKNGSGNYTVYVATNKGLQVSTDKGATWFNPIKLNIATCVGELGGKIYDVIITKDNKVLVAHGTQGLYVSDTGDQDCTYENVSDGIGGSARMSLAACPNDGNIVYAFQTQGDRTFEVLKSTDGGDSWAPMTPAPPTAVVDSTFDLLGFNPVKYNHALAVDPNNCDNIYVGAVDLYRVSGAWTSVATRARFPGFYVHADKHFFLYDPKDPNTMYVGSDGGIGKTTNAADGLVNWTENNRHYATTQYYGLAVTRDGKIVAGAQDNGNHVVDPSLPGVSGMDGKYLWTLGDGIDCDVSTIGDIAFVTSQRGNVGRDYLDGSQPAVQIHGNGAQSTLSPFITVVRLWESKNDVTSKDSVVFLNDTSRFSVGNGDGNKQVFTGKLRKTQASAKIVPGTVQLVDIAGGQSADDSDELGILKSFGDSVGVIDYITGAFSIRWNFAPPLGSSVNSVFSVKYNAGDTISLVSENQLYPFEHVLVTALTTNDSVIVQDPIQTLLAVSMNTGINITRESLYESATPEWISINTITPTSMEYSKDGNHLYLGGNGGVVRISGLNDLYSGVLPGSVLTQTTIYTGNTMVSGLCIHPTDPGKLLITTGGFGTADHIYELTNAQNGNSASAGKRSLQGSMPDFPVYDPEYNVNKPAQVLLGTEYGVWTTDDINSTTPTWTQENGGIGNVLVMDVLQQRLSFDEASNYGKFYLATYGRGLWLTDDLVSVEDNFVDFADNAEVSNLKLYPNPVSFNGKVSFDMPVNGTAEIDVYDISGKLISRESKNFSKGEVTHEFTVVNMPAGTYFMSVRVGNSQQHAKFVVVK